MPTYEYRCPTCQMTFSVVQSMAEHDKGEVRCPQCRGTDVIQMFSTFYAKTDKKS